jgi:hypothetical protein
VHPPYAAAGVRRVPGGGPNAQSRFGPRGPTIDGRDEGSLDGEDHTDAGNGQLQHRLWLYPTRLTHPDEPRRGALTRAPRR